MTQQFFRVKILLSFHSTQHINIDKRFTRLLLRFDNLTFPVISSHFSRCFLKHVWINRVSTLPQNRSRIKLIQDCMTDFVKGFSVIEFYLYFFIISVKVKTWAESVNNIAEPLKPNLFYVLTSTWHKSVTFYSQKPCHKFFQKNVKEKENQIYTFFSTPRRGFRPMACNDRQGVENIFYHLKRQTAFREISHLLINSTSN